MYIMTELENWVCCFLWTQLNAYFSPSSLPNLSEAHNFSAANTNMVLNFPKLERHILVWKAFRAILHCIDLRLLALSPCSLSLNQKTQKEKQTKNKRNKTKTNKQTENSGKKSSAYGCNNNHFTHDHKVSTSLEFLSFGLCPPVYEIS